MSRRVRPPHPRPRLGRDRPQDVRKDRPVEPPRGVRAPGVRGTGRRRPSPNVPTTLPVLLLLPVHRLRVYIRDSHVDLHEYPLGPVCSWLYGVLWKQVWVWSGEDLLHTVGKTPPLKKKTLLKFERLFNILIIFPEGIGKRV